MMYVQTDQPRDWRFPSSVGVAATGWIILAVLVVIGPAARMAVADPALHPPQFHAERDALEARLAEARRDLRLSKLTLERIQAQFAEVLRDPSPDLRVFSDYANYVDKVNEMTAVHERVVRALEADAGVARTASDDADWPKPAPGVFTPNVPSSDDDRSDLDRAFDASLDQFDAFLRAEYEEAQRRLRDFEDGTSQEEMTDLAREAAAAVERLRNKGIDVNTGPSSNQPGGQSPTMPGGGSGAPSAGEGGSGAPPSTEAGAGSESNGAPGSGSGSGSGPGPEGTGATTRPGENHGSASGAPGSPGQPGAGSPNGAPGSPGEGEGPGEGQGDGTGTTPGGGTGGSGQATGTGGGSGGSGPGAAPGSSGSGSGGTPPSSPRGDRPPAADDDIVARQLRAAAERETDPELRERLWEEYDRYKGSS